MRLPSALPHLLLLVLTLALTPPVGAAEAEPLPPAKPVRVEPPPHRTWEFAEDGVTFDTRFDMSRMNECTRVGRDEYLAVTQPENLPINQSPWFAFKVSATTAKTIVVRINCSGTRLRYIPKISVDGRNWIQLPAEAFTVGTTKRDEGTLRLKVGPEPLYVAAQEIISGEILEAWGRTLERLPFVTRSTIGQSVLGRPIYQLMIDAQPTHPAYVVILSRQHPPETTGSQALMRFVETLVGDTPLARSFRQEFAVLLVPMINPDGVAAGHWRHNMNGLDLNRDWGVFSQPETRAVSAQIFALAAKGPIYFHADFHSNFFDVFYNQPDDEPSSLPGFGRAWIEGIQRRAPGYEVKRSATRTPTLSTSHNWAHKRFGIPTVTYEIGDNTERTLFQNVAVGAAQEMMTLLLEAKKAAATKTP